MNKIVNTATAFIQHSSAFITVINKVSIGYHYNIVLCVHTKNILNLFKKFLYIIIDRHSEVMCAKYGRSRMNNVHTICLADFVSLPAKVVWPTAFFSKKKAIFVQHLCQPSASQPRSQLLKCF